MKWYQILVDVHDLSDDQSHALVSQLYKNEVYLSPHVRLSGLNRVAMIDSRSLAKRYADACEKVFLKRKQSVVSKVVECSCSPSMDKIQKILVDEHSVIVAARLDQNILATKKT